MAEKVRKVFLVDADPKHNQMLKDHLGSKLNIEITTFTSGEDCLRNLDQNPNIVVLDYHLDAKGNSSAANGLEILKKIKSAQPQTEVVMLSRQDNITVAVETMKNGAFDYVIKNESAMVRTQNILLNIFKGIKLREKLKSYKSSTFLLAGVIIMAVLITAIVLYL